MKRFKKEQVVLFLLICLLGGGADLPIAEAAEETAETVLIVNNEIYTPDIPAAQPSIINDRMYVPLRLVSSGLGHEVAWYAEYQQIVIVTKDSKASVAPHPRTETTLQIIVDEQELLLNEMTGTPFMLEGGYTMVPLRVVATALGCDVSWEEGLVIVEETPKVVEPSEEIFYDEVKPQTGGNDFSDSINNRYELSIFGPSIATQEQIEAFLADQEAALKKKFALTEPEREFIPYPSNIVSLYLEIGAKYNIRGDLALAQAIKETGYFQFGGSVQYFQNNYCGLGATGTPLLGNEPLNGVSRQKAFYLSGMHGLSFTTPAYGVEAHIQHLYAYACNQDLPSDVELLDPRFKYVRRGTAPRWIDLNGRWAVPGDGYGESIIDDYWAKMLNY